MTLAITRITSTALYKMLWQRLGALLFKRRNALFDELSPSPDTAKVSRVNFYHRLF